MHSYSKEMDKFGLKKAKISNRSKRREFKHQMKILFGVIILYNVWMEQNKNKIPFIS